jgi:hypothetical protein
MPLCFIALFQLVALPRTMWFFVKEELYIIKPGGGFCEEHDDANKLE